MAFIIIALLFSVFGLIKDFNRDKGQNTKAKVLHVICLAILIGSYAGSFRILGLLIRDFEGTRQRFSVNVGLVSAQVHWILFLVHTAVVLIVLILAYSLINRNEKSRKRLVMILPLAGLLEVFSFYRGWFIQQGDYAEGHTFVILLGFVIIGSIAAFIFLVYTSRFMKVFFLFGSGANPEQEVRPIDYPAEASVTNNLK